MDKRQAQLEMQAAVARLDAAREAIRAAENDFDYAQRQYRAAMENWRQFGSFADLFRHRNVA
jgi:membrane peptidoglycan carboxypeptidase